MDAVATQNLEFQGSADAFAQKYAENEQPDSAQTVQEVEN